MTDPTMKPPNSLQLPTVQGQTLSPAITQPQKLNITGSATGNPRNKCALKPGHSLMAWIRLGNSGVDLAGTHGRITPISSEQLAQHNTREDAWLAIRGKVYNVTRYMDFHPGGVDELMRGVGRDATKLFDDVHAWVNYQQLLVKCYIGPLRSGGKMAVIPEGKTQSTADLIKSSTTATTLTEIVPRFDWIQKRQEVTFYLYTRQFCNPGLLLQRRNDKALRLQVQIENILHLFELELHEHVEWPPQTVRVDSETGKIEVTLMKSEAALWSSYGAHTVTKLAANADETELQYEYEIVERHEFNHDSCELSIKCVQDIVLVVPVAYHVSIGALVNGELVRRSYTPVNAKYLQKSSVNVTNESTLTNLNFLIKCYSGGALTPHLRQLQPNNALLLSLPRGNLSLSRLLQHRQIVLLAAGSGLTPFLNLIEHLLRRNTNRIDYLRLVYFNKTEADIWCRDALHTLQTADERFTCVHVLSAPNADWTGLNGRVSTALLTPLLDKNSSDYASFAAVCGTSAFNQAVEELLKSVKFNLQNVHVFQG